MTLTDLIIKDITNQNLTIDEAEYPTDNIQYKEEIREALLSCGIDTIEDSINHNFTLYNDINTVQYKVVSVDVKAKQQKLLKEI